MAGEDGLGFRIAFLAPTMNKCLNHWPAADAQAFSMGACTPFSQRPSFVCMIKYANRKVCLGFLLRVGVLKGFFCLPNAGIKAVCHHLPADFQFLHLLIVLES